MDTGLVTPYAFRLAPHTDLKKALLEFALQNKLQAAAVVSAVGSLEQVNLRFANRSEGSMMKGHFEILSLSGTLSSTACHLHLGVANGDGQTLGGHLLEGNLVYTTAEIVLLELLPYTFLRERDNTYNYLELVVKPRHTGEQA